MPTSVQLPRRLSDITLDWLNHVLGRDSRRIVTGFELSDVIATTSTKVRLHLQYADANGSLPRTMILKGSFSETSHEADPLFFLINQYKNEAVFYRDIASSMPVAVPRVFWADVDDATGLVLMEDLNIVGATYGAATRHYSPDLVAQALEYQAAYHAQWWGKPMNEAENLLRFDATMDWFFRQQWFVKKGSPQAAHLALNRPLIARAHDFLSERLPVFERAVKRVAELNRGVPPALIHFDAHPGNMYFDRDGQPRWLDWQLCTRGAWAWDVAYFITGALTIEDRRKHERALLQHYIQQLRARGVSDPPGADSAWHAYRQNVIWGLSWGIVPVTMQAAQNTNIIVERFAAAIDDLEPLAALGLDNGEQLF